MLCLVVAVISAYSAGYNRACARWHHHMACSWEMVGDRLKERGYSEPQDFLEAFGRPPEGM